MKILFDNTDWTCKNTAFRLEEGRKYVYVVSLTRWQGDYDTTTRFEKSRKEALLTQLEKEGYVPFDIFDDGTVVKSSRVD